MSPGEVFMIHGNGPALQRCVRISSTAIGASGAAIYDAAGEVLATHGGLHPADGNAPWSACKSDVIVDGKTVGVLCAFDDGGRIWSAADVAMLEDIAAMVAERFEIDARDAATAEQVALESMAETDELTGLLNRRGFRRLAERRVADAHRFGLPVTLVAADLDGFKLINDTLGHGAGDQALTEFAAMASEVIRHTDLVARFGGDEFAMLLFGCDEAAAADIIARLEKAMAWTHGNQARPFNLSASIGSVTRRHTDDGDLASLLEAADHQMHVQKGQRRQAGIGVDIAVT